MSEQTAALPGLPEVAYERFIPAIRDQVHQAYDDARSHPTDASASGKLGMALQAYSQFEEAEVCYRRASLLDPTSFQWVYYLGVVQAEQGKYEEAAATFRQSLRLEPDYLPAQLRLADCLLATAHWEESGKLDEAVLAREAQNAAAHYGLGRVRAARKDLEGAVGSFLKSCDLFPEFGAAHYALALAYRKLGRMEESRKEFSLYEKYVTRAPPGGDAIMAEVQALNLSAVYQVRQGMDQEQAGRLEQAAAAHEKALQIDPQLVEAHVNLISIYGRLSQYEKAEEHYQAAIRLNPNDAEAHYDYGVLLFGQGKYPEADKAFRKALEINPFYAEAHNNLGVLLEQQGRWQEAAEQFRQAIENQPGFRLAHFHLGRIFVNQGNYQDGIQELLKTLQPEDQNTPAYLYALGAAYARAGDRVSATRYLHMAKERASARGQSRLLASIEKDLKTLEGEGAPR